MKDFPSIKDEIAFEIIDAIQDMGCDMAKPSSRLVAGEKISKVLEKWLGKFFFITEEELDERIEHESTSGYELGICEGIDRVARGLRKKAGDIFAQGDDEVAKVFRAMANKLDEEGRKQRDAYDKKYPKDEA